MAERRRQWQGRQLELEQAMHFGPRHCSLVLIGITMRFAERILGCRLGGYMCREFVGMNILRRGQLVGVAIIEQHIEGQDKSWVNRPRHI